MAYSFTQWNDEVAENIRELCGDALRLMDTTSLAHGYHEAYQAGVTVRQIAQETIRFARFYAGN
jgi:hypothetical protein